MLAHLPKDLRQSQVGIAPPVTDMRGFPPRTHTPRSKAGTPPVTTIAELLEPSKQSILANQTHLPQGGRAQQVYERQETALTIQS